MVSRPVAGRRARLGGRRLAAAGLAVACLSGCGAAEVVDPVGGPGAAECAQCPGAIDRDTRPDGPAPADGGPASVGGRWSGLDDPRDPGPVESRLLGCTDDLRSLDGLPAASVEPQCVALEPATVVQSGATFTIVRAPVSCRDGIVRARSGGGTVDGETIIGAVDLVDGTETRTRRFAGSIEGNRLVLAFDRLEVRGLSDGNCLISPPLGADVVVLP